MEREYFTEAEASALVGQRIKTLVAWSGVPEGTTGKVTRADRSGADRSGDGYTVVITWELPTEPPLIADLEIAGEPVIYVQTGKPLTDWFTRSEYEQYLEELAGNEPTTGA